MRHAAWDRLLPPMVAGEAFGEEHADAGADRADNEGGEQAERRAQLPADPTPDRPA